jgi:hypothetical protein
LFLFNILDFLKIKKDKLKKKNVHHPRSITSLHIPEHDGSVRKEQNAFGHVP